MRKRKRKRERERRKKRKKETMKKEEAMDDGEGVKK